ncbi:hypothetical protein ES708_10421 [subsurface metagenome]
MFKPLYTITNKLLANIKKISSIIIELNNRRFQKVVLYELEKKAREISTYASASIEGNPLPLTDVKQIIKNKPENLRDSEQEIINYNAVLEELNINLQKQSINFNIDLVLSVHKKIVNKLLPKYQLGKLRKEPMYVFERIDILVLSSLYKEGLPNVLLEAMSMKVPVVSSKMAGVPEIVKDGETGYMVEPGKSDQLTEAISKLWSDKAAYKKMSENGRKLMEENFNKEVQFTKFLDYFHRITGK